MASNLGKVFIFAAGAAIGSLITYKVVKDKMEETIEQEVNEIREHYKTKLEETEEIHDDSEYFVYEEDEEVEEIEGEVETAEAVEAESEVVESQE